MRLRFPTLLFVLLHVWPAYGQHAGQWVGSVDCGSQVRHDGAWRLTLRATELQPGRYDLRAGLPSAQGAGGITGAAVHFTVGNRVARMQCDGEVDGDRMSGRCRNPEPVCVWQARLPR